MVYKLKLIIEYDGTDFHGWQIQPDQPTIQNEIQKILSTMTHEPVTVVGSGRTDAGVHALAQTAHFETNSTIPPEKFHMALNRMLPGGIVIKQCHYVPASFHARFKVINKTYKYHIYTASIPAAINRHFHWHIPRKLDVKNMQKAADCLVGTHDFKAFEGSGSPRPHTTRTVSRAEFSSNNDALIFTITANGFLKFMVRNIVGTLVDVGTGMTSPARVDEILKSRDRTLAGRTAPPQGLFLVAVNYDPGAEHFGTSA